MSTKVAIDGNGQVEHENAIFLRTGDWTAYIIPNRVFDDTLSLERFLKIVRKFHLRTQPPVDVLPVADVGAGR
ncbi:MAG TPA: YcxB family protein [Gemmataceae bacterium]|nr:YcxB family protein [Gemmataceae bacterium]